MVHCLETLLAVNVRGSERQTAPDVVCGLLFITKKKKKTTVHYCLELNCP